jgi:LuxR family maltose regulon positive regulatory protein
MPHRSNTSSFPLLHYPDVEVAARWLEPLPKGPRRVGAGDGMTEPPASSPDVAATRARDELLTTKVNIPRTRPDRLARSQLLVRLNEGMDRKLILLCAPAGFGKTTLLADWATSANGAVAWLSLDPDDNDPARFWRYVIAALDRAREGFGEQLLPLLTAPTPLSGHGVVTALVNQLQAQPDELALVLDDYHTIEEPAIHDSLALLLSHLPSRLHLGISSRSDPPLPLARLRAGGQLTELRAADLRFTPGESAAFLQEVWKLDLPVRTVAALETRTEGWAVGLQLAALSLQGRPDPEGFLDAFTGTHRYVLDYLTEEVLARQPERVRTFLLQTSILERLNGPLCDAVTGDSDSQGMLEELQRANLFLVPLDEERRWWRLHHLFADLLRARVVQLQPDLVPELHRRAAAWCEPHGLIDEAIRHALAAGDTLWATRLVEEHLDAILRRGESAILERWLSLLPDDAVRSRPALCLAQALLRYHSGHFESTERLLEHAQRGFDHGQQLGEVVVPTEGGMVAKIPAAIALLRAELAVDRGDADATAAFASAALAELAEQEHGPRLLARWLLAVADCMRGRLADAEPTLDRLLAEGRAAPTLYPLLSSCITLGLVQQTRGRLGAALRTYREGLRFATQGGRFSAYHAGEAHLGMALVLYERNELDDALRQVTEGVKWCRQVIELTELHRALVALAWIRQALGQADAALDAMNEACRIYPWQDIVDLAYGAPSERARLLLAQGRADEAVRRAQERGLTEDDAISFQREGSYLVLARVLLARSASDRALGLLERLDALADSQGRTGSLIKIRALRSLALQATGDHQGALTLLAEALSLAAPEGYVRVFVDEGAPMASLLGRLAAPTQRERAAAAENVPRDYLARLLASFRPAAARSSHLAGRAGAGLLPGLVEPLSERELEVLGLLATGRSNQQIAEELVVVLDTVKKHVSRILDKLGVANRTQAVARARELQLLR